MFVKKHLALLVIIYIYAPTSFSQESDAVINSAIESLFGAEKLKGLKFNKCLENLIISDQTDYSRLGRDTRSLFYKLARGGMSIDDKNLIRIPLIEIEGKCLINDFNNIEKISTYISWLNYFFYEKVREHNKMTTQEIFLTACAKANKAELNLNNIKFSTITDMPLEIQNKTVALCEQKHKSWVLK